MNSGYKMAAALGAIFGFAALLMAAVALVAAEDEGGSAEAGAGRWSVEDSVRPRLTPIAELSAAPADEQHVSYAPDVPAPIRIDRRRLPA